MDISERHKQIVAELRKLDAAHLAKRKVIEGQLLAVQHECPHPNMKVTGDSGWGRMPSTYHDCPDCGYHRSL